VCREVGSLWVSWQPLTSRNGLSPLVVAVAAAVRRLAVFWGSACSGRIELGRCDTPYNTVSYCCRAYTMESRYRLHKAENMDALEKGWSLREVGPAPAGSRQAGPKAEKLDAAQENKVRGVLDTMKSGGGFLPSIGGSVSARSSSAQVRCYSEPCIIRLIDDHAVRSTLTRRAAAF